MKDQTTFHTLWPAANGTRTTPSISAMVARKKKKKKFFIFLASSGREGATTRSASRPSRVITAVHILLLHNEINIFYFPSALQRKRLPILLRPWFTFGTLASHFHLIPQANTFLLLFVASDSTVCSRSSWRPFYSWAARCRQ